MIDADDGLQLYMKSLLTLAKLKAIAHKNWQSGDPLKLLLVGYVGARNTGADVRTAEIIRQLQHLLKTRPYELTIATLNPQLTQGYFSGAKQITMPHFFPHFVANECLRHDGIITCEGSMFKSKFATALSTMMASALGMANLQNKLSVGYGAEAGDMTKGLRNFVREHCKHSLIICRNNASRDILQQLNIRTAAGTDTAWTFTPNHLEQAPALLRKTGWDGSTPILAIAPINPFWWPVKPNIRKSITNLVSRRYRAQHHQSIYFHEYSAEDKVRYDRYINGIATGVKAFMAENKVFPIIIGMERLDAAACKDLSRQLGGGIPVFESGQYDMHAIVSILRHSHLLLSSRFHGIVTCMSARVPSAGITMDERIYNLMQDRGHMDLLLHVDSMHLSDEVHFVLNKLWQNRDKISHEIGMNVPKQLLLMGQMGQSFISELERIYPESVNVPAGKSWEYYLPTLAPDLYATLEAFA